MESGFCTMSKTLDVCWRKDDCTLRAVALPRVCALVQILCMALISIYKSKIPCTLSQHACVRKVEW
jgi:hypothetical protein